MKKPHQPTKGHASPEPNANTLPAIVAVVVIAGLAWGLYRWQAPEQAQPMEVRVTINNQCDLVDGAFMAASEPDGAKAGFSSGVAVLHTLSTSKVYIKGSDNYPAFKIDTAKVNAAPNLTIKVQCAPGEKIDPTLEAMRKQFKRDKH